jgi:hypothetical protein
MRVATLPLCLMLAACAGTLPGEQPAPGAAAAPGATAAPAAAAKPATGGPATAAKPVPASPPVSDSEFLRQARVDCWMKVEHQKGLRNIDRRILFVDKCVADAVKAR